MIGLVREHPGEWWIAPVAAVIAAALILLPLSGALALIGGGLALIAVLRFPELALYALILAVPYGSWFPIPIGVGNLTAVDLLIVVVLALWVARMIGLERAIRIRIPLLAAPLALFLGAALVSITAATSLEYAAKEFVKWLELAAVYVFVANDLDEVQVTRVLAVWLLAGLSQAAIGIYQFVFRAGPEGFALFGRFMRAYGTFEQPNPYAGYLGLVIPVALGVVIGTGTVLLSSVSNRNLGTLLRTWSWRQVTWTGGLGMLATAALVAMLAALLMSWSRGAWVGVGVALVFVAVMQSRRAFVVSTVAGFVLIMTVLLSSINLIPGAVAERFSGIGDYFGIFDVRGVKVDDTNFAIVERMAHWQAAVEMFADHPALGVGIGNYVPAYSSYALPRWSDPLGHAHNYYLNIAAETGTVGLLAYLILWGTALWQGWRAVCTSHGLARGVAAGLLGMMIALGIHNGFDNLFVHGMAAQVGIGLGMVSAITGDKMRGNRQGRSMDGTPFGG